jgi:aryl-alcohol dehydrogenase-like predicted oxidoreductase
VQARQFGSTDLTVSEIGFGCARIGGIFQGLSRADYRRTLSQALDAGITFFDTSDMYCNGESEQILGETFGRQRERVIIASKAGYSVPRQRHLAMRIKPLLRPLIRMAGIKRHHLPVSVAGALGQDFSPDYLVRSVEGSLRRLRTDYLDLFQLHSPPPSVLEAGEFLSAAERLKRDGKIRYFGISCETTADARIALRHAGIDALQLQISLLETSALDEVLPACAARGIGVIARECFGGGLLTRPLDELGLEHLIADPVRRAEVEGRIRASHAAADARSVSMRELALQFVLGQEAVSVALLGMRTDLHLAGNLKLLEHRLSPAMLAGVR